MKSIKLFFERYSEFLMADIDKPDLTEEERKYREDSYLRFIGQPPKYNVKFIRSKENNFKIELFQRTTEIITCFYKLHDYKHITLINSNKKSDRIPAFDNPLHHKLNVFRIRYEWFLHNAYMLEERMLNLANWIKNRYKKHSKYSTEILAIVTFSQEYNNVIKRNFLKVRTARSLHVHQYLHENKEISVLGNLATMAYLGKIPGKELSIFKFDFNQRYKKYNRYTVKTVDKWIADIDKLMNDFIGQLYSLLYTQNGDFIYPSSLDINLRKNRLSKLK